MKVTELDFRLPEYRDAKVEDYEFREDGKLVRKDRWERGICSIKHLVLGRRKDWEISDVVDAVSALVERDEGWAAFDDFDYENMPKFSDLLLEDGSELRQASYMLGACAWVWQGQKVVLGIVAFRGHKTLTPKITNK